ncbi:hypothetical protein BDW59DRAFT_163578 [Aspergillus cavernicola]|uniref:Mid2 domain-containing protein n=1 Tax=Aspergillus cavernicola TaxID=176166 RepID=A0ABR4I4T0_9EURO
MSEASTFGWPAREIGSCLTDLEDDCGVTIEPFHVCCPQGSYCPNAYNVACCPSEANCTEALQASPHCANRTWDLYINGGYFCCQPGSTGYATNMNSNGCGTPGDDDTPLEIISSGSAVPTSTSTSTSPPLTSATETEATDSSNSSSGTDTGAIAGGIIGGVAGAAIIAVLLWFLFRTRRQRAPPSGAIPITEYYNKEAPISTPLAEMDGQQPAELGGGYHMVAELPGHYGR